MNELQELVFNKIKTEELSPTKLIQSICPGYFQYPSPEQVQEILSKLLDAYLIEFSPNRLLRIRKNEK